MPTGMTNNIFNPHHIYQSSEINLYIFFRIKQKMMENDFCEENVPRSPSRVFAYNLSNGYYGKPTKSRCSQPSMFQILTWTDGTRCVGQEQVVKACCECNCQCSQNCQTSNKQRKTSPQMVQNQQSQQQVLQVKQIQNKPKQSENRKGQQKSKQKIREQPMNRNISPKSKNPYQSQKLQRPKSAVTKSKNLTSPAKLPKFIGDAIQQQKDQVQEQPAETKQKLIEKFKQTTRWIPNSAFTTYFGKPAFQNYGRGNTNPSFGGLMYGNYLKSHNIQPHRGTNSPKSIQSYNIALTKGQEAGALYPYPPKASKKAHVKLGETGDGCSDVQCTQIYAEENCIRSLPIHPPNLLDLEKFGGKGISKIARNREREREKENQEEWHRDGAKSGQTGSKKQIY